MTDHPPAIQERLPLGPSKIWTDLDLDREGRQFGYFRMNISSHGRGGVIPIPVAIFKNGNGPRVLLLGGAHGDEYEGQVMAMKLLRTLDVNNVQGQIIIMSATNAPAAFAGQRTSPLDEGDLNRSYPGDPKGSFTQQIAYFIDTVLLSRVDYLLDFHSGGNGTRVIPSAHVYHTDDKEKFARLVHMLKVFGMPTSVILKGLHDHDKKAVGACDRRNVLRFASELGGGGGITIDALRRAEKGLARLLFDLGVLRKPLHDEPAPPIELVQRLPNSRYLYSMAAGLFEPYVEVGDEVRAGQPAAAVHFPQEPWREPWIATFADNGRVYAMRTRATVQLGDRLYSFYVPWKE